MKKIAIEEHINSSDLNTIDKRLRDMDEAGINMQVLSFSLGGGGFGGATDPATSARNVNNTLA